MNLAYTYGGAYLHVLPEHQRMELQEVFLQFRREEEAASMQMKSQWRGFLLPWRDELFRRLRLLALFLAPFLTASALSAADFPLRPSADRRYLEDQKGRPFFMSGDSPWDIFQNVELADARAYLDDRQRRGFNTLLVTLVADRHDLMTNRWGEYPFLAPLDFTQPNDPYWKRVDAVMDEMAKRGFLVVACPTWLGAGKPIWRDGITPEAMKSYGTFIVKRYGHNSNLIWLLGGDRNPESDSGAGIRTLAEILQRGAPHQLISYHAFPEFASARFFHEEPWLQLNSAYTYRQSYEHLPSEWSRRNPIRPVWLCETGYDGEGHWNHDWTPPEVRKQHYWALTSGACGHAHGSKQLWWFGPGWQEWLDRPATHHMEHIRSLFQPRSWWKLVPDLGNTFLTAGTGERGSWDYATAALAGDGSWGLVFVPSSRKIRVDLSRMRGAVTARWFDPTSGAFSQAEVSTLENRSSHEFRPPGKNAAGDDDWVLVLEALAK